MFPRWMKWLFILFLGYLLLLGHRVTQEEKTVAAVPASPVALHEKTYPSLAAAFDENRWRRAVNPHYAAPKAPCTLGQSAFPDRLGPTVIDVSPGDGAAAACGDAVFVRITVWSHTGYKAYVGDVPLTLGDEAVAAGIDMGLVGLQVHGERMLLLPPDALERRKDSKAPAALLKALPTNQVVLVSVTRLR